MHNAQSMMHNLALFCTMHNLFRHGLIGFIATLMMAMLSSCVYEDFPANSYTGDGRMNMVLHLSTVNQKQSSLNPDAPLEKIKSLRVIVLSNGFIEINEHIDLPEELPTGQFSYALERQSVAGKKDFYFIANEESIGSVYFQSSSLPSGVQNGMSIRNLWDLYKAEVIPDKDDNNSTAPTGKGDELKTVLNSLYFEPRLQSYDVSESNVIYLPYSVSYSGYEIKLDEKTGGLSNITDVYFHLVPVATKFEFQFVNNRSHSVELSDLTIYKFDNLNFLYAQVGVADLYKTLPEETEKLYWPDWLAEVSKESWLNIGSSDESLTFGNKYGWIKDYSIPSGSQRQPENLLQLGNTSSNPKVIIPEKTLNPDADTDEIPGNTILGPYYLPESGFNNNYQYPYKDKDNKDITITANGFLMYFKLKDTFSDSIYEWYNVLDNNNQPVPSIIENIGSLFRNTHVIIKVVMSEGLPLVEGVYAEIVPFNPVNSWGYVGGYVN